MTCCIAVGYFLAMMSIHTLVLNFAGKAGLQWILFADWDI